MMQAFYGDYAQTTGYRFIKKIHEKRNKSLFHLFVIERNFYIEAELWKWLMTKATD